MTDRTDLLSLLDLARHCGCRVQIVERFYQLGVFDERESRDHEPLFDRVALERLVRAIRLRREMRVGASGLGLVLDLLDEVERLRSNLSRSQ